MLSTFHRHEIRPILKVNHTTLSVFGKLKAPGFETILTELFNQWFSNLQGWF